MSQNANEGKLQVVTESKWLDLVGVVLILAVSLSLGFHKTIAEHAKFLFWTIDIPIGIFSTVGAVGSMMVTRWVTKRNNIGNAVGLLTAINSGFVDYYLGNEAAYLTYPISFIGAGASYYYWKRKGDRVPRKVDSRYFLMAGMAFVLAFFLNYVGFTEFFSAPIGHENMAKYWVTALITGITFSGTLNTPRMYADTWAFWQVYNVLKLYQNILFGNIAFVAKYAFYLGNATLGWLVWHRVRRQAAAQVS